MPMKLRSLLILTSILSLASLLPSAHAGADTPLEKQMQTLARGTKRLSLQVGDPAKQQDTVTLIESLKQAVTESKPMEPRETASVAPADREKFLSDYRAQLDKLTAAYDQIEVAVKAGQYDQAKSLLTSIGPIKKEGHQKFKQD